MNSGEVLGQAKEFMFKTGAVLSATLAASLGGVGVGESVALADVTPTPFTCPVDAHPECADLPVGTTGTFQTNPDGSTETNYDFNNGDPNAIPPLLDATEKVIENTAGKTQFNDFGDGSSVTCNFFPRLTSTTFGPEESCKHANGTDNGGTPETNTGPSSGVIRASLQHDQNCVNELVKFDSSQSSTTSTYKHPTYSYKNLAKRLHHTRVGKFTIKLPSMDEIDSTCGNVELTARAQIKESSTRDMKHAHNISGRFTAESPKENDGKAHYRTYRRGKLTGKHYSFARLEFYATTTNQYTGARIASVIRAVNTKPQRANKSF